MSVRQEIEIKAWLNSAGPCTASKRAVSELAYTLSEHGMWPDGVDSVSPEQVFLCWRLVQKLIETGNGFPAEFRM